MSSKCYYFYLETRDKIHTVFTTLNPEKEVFL